MRFLHALLPLSLLLASCSAQENVGEVTASPDELPLALERYASLENGESDFQEALTGSAVAKVRVRASYQFAGGTWQQSDAESWLSSNELAISVVEIPRRTLLVTR